MRCLANKVLLQTYFKKKYENKLKRKRKKKIINFCIERDLAGYPFANWAIAPTLLLSPPAAVSIAILLTPSPLETLHTLWVDVMPSYFHVAPLFLHILIVQLFNDLKYAFEVYVFDAFLFYLLSIFFLQCI